MCEPCYYKVGRRVGGGTEGRCAHIVVINVRQNNLAYNRPGNIQIQGRVRSENKTRQFIMQLFMVERVEQ